MIKYWGAIIILLLVKNSLISQPSDTTNRTAEKIKSGWNFGILPAVSYDTDLGFQYGVLTNFYHYGDGSNYPQYEHSFYLEVSRYTKGSGIYRFAYDSEYLIPKIRLTADVSYIPNQVYNFYGFNGYEAVYHPAWIDDSESSDIYKTRVFYKYDNKMFRFKSDLSGPLAGKHIRWLAGIEWYDFKTGTVDIDKLNKGKSEDKKLPPIEEQPTLYNKYLEWGLIPTAGAGGGRFAQVKAGLVFDTRDNQPNPMKGIWIEAAVLVTPKFLSSLSEGFSQFSITHRQYFTLVPNDLSLAYRLAYQTLISGKIPFYAKPLMITSELRGATNEGLGGVRNLRGIPRNRVVGDGVVYANLELRWKFFRTQLFNQNFYFGLNAFFDAGRITRMVPVETLVNEIDDPDFVKADYFDFGAESFHMSFGTGLRIAMNQNFIIAVDWGKAADRRDGKSGLYVGLNYLF
nr:BamA/TamA family outer membrane protein [Bacteroidota bacterium]